MEDVIFRSIVGADSGWHCIKHNVVWWVWIVV